jgi:hypothetical protein
MTRRDVPGEKPTPARHLRFWPLLIALLTLAFASRWFGQARVAQESAHREGAEHHTVS